MADSSKASSVNKIEKSEMLSTQQTGSSGITYQTIGTILQALSVQLDENETVYSVAGNMSWMTQNIKMETISRGIAKIFSRVLTGETLFVNQFRCTQGTGVVTFSSNAAGKIIPVDLITNGPDIIFQRGSFLCAENNVHLSVALTKKLSAGLFGGKGLILNKLTGNGKAHLTADGEVVMYELTQGQEILVDQGSLVAYESTVDFDIQTIGGGLMSWIFGGEGLFWAVMRGPGKIWLQTNKTNLVSGVNTANTNRGQAQQGGALQNPLGCIIGFIIFFAVIAFIFLGAILSSR
jgi:uncharacterized protein (TIGR00266 family)